MIPLTQIYGQTEELCGVVDATDLECMLVALSFPVISVKRPKIGSMFYKVNLINFLQDVNSFIGVTDLLRTYRNTTYFLLWSVGRKVK